MYKFKVKSYKREEVIELRSNQISKQDGNWVIDLGYGYESHWGNWCTEGFDSVLPGNRYRIFHEWHPFEGDIITHIKSGRVFTVGKIDGFIRYQAPLLENGIEVATIKFEEYYKD